MTIELTYNDIILDVEGTYLKEEPRDSYCSDGSGYPGSPAEFKIEDVFCREQSIYNILTTSLLLDLETLILEKLHE